MQKPPLNFDYQSSTPCSERVLKAMQPYWNELWGNPSNRQTRIGLNASAAISLARDNIANCLEVSPERIIFTSGATEANNLALIGHARARAKEVGRPGHLITISTEHHSVLDPLRQLKNEGFSITELNPKPDGILCLKELENAFNIDTFLVSIMLANNEIGVIQPIQKVSQLCKDKGVTLHSDAAQAFGNISINFDDLGIDLMTISSHKIYGPKGIGALVIRENISIEPLIWGGGQENGIRSGTLPVPLIIGFAKASEIALEELDQNNIRVNILRNKLWDDLSENIPGLLINGSLNERLFHNLNFTIGGVIGTRLQKLLKPLIVCSSSSACSNGSPSHVLMAIGRSSKEAESSLRLSLGRDTTMQDIKKAVALITKVIEELRS